MNRYSYKKLSVILIIIVKLIESWEVPNLVSLVVFLLGISLNLGFSLRRETSS